MIYRNYSVLPALKKLDGNIFQVDEHRPFFLEQKRMADVRFWEHEITPEIYFVVEDFIRSRFQAEHAEILTGGFSELAMQLQEDICIHRISDETDWLAAAHVCFPSGWNPAEKIGRTFREIHEPIPGMNLGMSRKLAETMVYHGPFERVVWGVTQNRFVRVRPQKEPFDPAKPIYVKYERQVTVGFPAVRAALFTIRQHVIEDVDLKVLRDAIAGMTPEQKEYKGISASLQSYLAEV
jgi:hypothetical protein